MDLLLLVLLIVMCLLLVALLSVLMYRQGKTQTVLLLSLVQSRETMIQSLLNQLRATTAESLLTLNAATNPSHYSPTEEYISHSDGAEFLTLPVGIGDDLTLEDMQAFGDAFIPEGER